MTREEGKGWQHFPASGYCGKEATQHLSLRRSPGQLPGDGRPRVPGHVCRALAASPAAREGHAARTPRAARFSLPADPLQPASAGLGLLSPPRRQAASSSGSAACACLCLRGGGGRLTPTWAMGRGPQVGLRPAPGSPAGLQSAPAAGAGCGPQTEVGVVRREQRAQAAGLPGARSRRACLGCRGCGAKGPGLRVAFFPLGSPRPP